MKLEVLVANEGALKVISELKLDDAQLAWDVSDAFDEIEKAITKFQKKRDAFVKEHGTPNPENPDRFNLANPEEFTKEMQKLLDVNVNIVFPKIPIKALKGLKVSVKEMRGWKALGIISNDKPGESEKVEEIEEAEEVKAEKVEAKAEVQENKN